MPEDLSTVENEFQGTQDDAALQPVEENTQAAGETLDAIAQEVEQAAEQHESTPPAKEPGWIRKRVDTAVAKAVKEAEERVSAQYEAMLAPIRESVLDRQAEDLVSSGEFKSLDTAKEYVRLKQGQTVVAKPEAKAEPVAETENPTITARAQLLAKQAEKIKSKTGVDVMAAFKADANIRDQVLSGEWDFYDVAENLQPASPKRAPAPIRSSNGGNVSSTSIANMTDAQFKRLQENLAAGRSYDVRK